MNSETKASWLVVGRIIGPLLPATPLRLGSATIFHMTSEQLEIMARGRPRMRGMDFDQPSSVSAIPPDLVVDSRWAVKLEVEASDPDEAEEIAEQDLLPPVVQALCSVSGPYWVELMRLEGEDEGGSTSSRWAMGHAVEVDLMPEDDRRTVQQAFRTLTKDKTAKTAGAYLYRAISLMPHIGGMPELAPAIVHNYFMAIEAIARHLTAQERVSLAPSIEADRAGIVGTLAARLMNGDGSKHLDERVRAIEDAARELQRVDLRLVALEIRTAGQKLTLQKELIEEATRLAAFRSQRLAHARSDVPPDEVLAWLGDDLAYDLARTFLDAYLRSISDEG